MINSYWNWEGFIGKAQQLTHMLKGEKKLEEVGFRWIGKSAKEDFLINRIGLEKYCVPIVSMFVDIPRMEEPMFGISTMY